jgi:hypothetical protein
MRFLGLLALTTIIGCHQMPVMQSGRVSFMSQPQASRTTSSSIKATCERKGKELHVTVPQQQLLGARAAVGTGMVAQGIAPMGVNPYAMQGTNAQYRVIPGRTSRAVTMGWTALPIPFPKLRRVQIAPTVAMTEGSRSSFLQPNRFGAQGMAGGFNGRMAPYGMAPAPYGMQGMGVANGVMPVGFAQGANMQSMQTIQLQRMLQQLQTQQRSAAPDKDKSAETEKVRARAATLEKKVNQLLDILEKRKAVGSAATESSDAGGIPAPGYTPLNPVDQNQTATNIEQTGAMIPRSAYRTSSDLELWQHSPQRR